MLSCNSGHNDQLLAHPLRSCSIKAISAADGPMIHPNQGLQRWRCGLLAFIVLSASCGRPPKYSPVNIEVERRELIEYAHRSFPMAVGCFRVTYDEANAGFRVSFYKEGPKCKLAFAQSKPLMDFVLTVEVNVIFRVAMDGMSIPSTVGPIFLGRPGRGKTPAAVAQVGSVSYVYLLSLQYDLGELCMPSGRNDNALAKVLPGQVLSHEAGHVRFNKWFLRLSRHRQRLLRPRFKKLSDEMALKAENEWLTFHGPPSSFRRHHDQPLNCFGKKP